MGQPSEFRVLILVGLRFRSTVSRARARKATCQLCQDATPGRLEIARYRGPGREYLSDRAGSLRKTRPAIAAHHAIASRRAPGIAGERARYGGMAGPNGGSTGSWSWPPPSPLSWPRLHKLVDQPQHGHADHHVLRLLQRNGLRLVAVGVRPVRDVRPAVRRAPHVVTVKSLPAGQSVPASRSSSLSTTESRTSTRIT